MNEDKYKFRLNKKGQRKNNRHNQGWFSGDVKPTGKFWKRYFNKKVRKGAIHKRSNWFHWS